MGNVISAKFMELVKCACVIQWHIEAVDSHELSDTESKYIICEHKH